MSGRPETDAHDGRGYRLLPTIGPPPAKTKACAAVCAVRWLQHHPCRAHRVPGVGRQTQAHGPSGYWIGLEPAPLVATHREFALPGGPSLWRISTLPATPGSTWPITRYRPEASGLASSVMA